MKLLALSPILFSADALTTSRSCAEGASRSASFKHPAAATNNGAGNVAHVHGSCHLPDTHAMLLAQQVCVDRAMVRDARLSPARAPLTNQQNIVRHAKTEMKKTALLKGAFPAKPGLEDAFAYACLQDLNAYAFADELLKKIDAVVGKMKGEQTCNDAPDRKLLAQKRKELASPFIGGGENPAVSSERKNALNDEIVALHRQFVERYAAVYGEDPLEIGTSGHAPLRIQQVIQASSPADGVQLREKMALIHHVMEWFPHEIQRNAGLTPYISLAQQQAAEANMTGADRAARLDKVRKYVDSLKLDFPVSVEHLANFSQWWMHSDTVRASYHTKKEEKTPHGRAMNERFFEPRNDVRDILNRSPWIRRPLEANRTVNLAQADPAFGEFVKNGSLHRYEPIYQAVRTDLLNGTCYFVLNKDRPWYQQNLQNENLRTMTGPSGTADIFIRLMDIFAMPLETKVNGLKALIGHMHLDDHHSVHEIMSATDGNKGLNDLIRYDGSLQALKRLSPDTFETALALQPRFVGIEIEGRNRVEEDRRAVFGS